MLGTSNQNQIVFEITWSKLIYLNEFSSVTHSFEREETRWGGRLYTYTDTFEFRTE